MFYEKGTHTEMAKSIPTRGWLIGHMIPEGGKGRTNDVEVKFWNFETPFPYGKKNLTGTECDIIFEGALRFTFEKEGRRETVEIDGDKKEYIIIEPNLVKSVELMKAPARGVTVRWPSLPGGNQVIEKA